MKIFISFRTEDKLIVQNMIPFLEQELKPNNVLSMLKFEAYNKWSDQIREYITKSDAVLVIITKNTFTDTRLEQLLKGEIDWIGKEIGIAMEQRTIIAPILMESDIYIPKEWIDNNEQFNYLNSIQAYKIDQSKLSKEIKTIIDEIQKKLDESNTIAPDSLLFSIIAILMGIAVLVAIIIILNLYL